MNAESFDYVVVGGGAAGCALAARLSEDPARRVVLLEAGEPDSNVLFRIPGLGFVVTTRPRWNWNFMTEPIEALNGRKLKVLSGRVLGGSSSINGMQYSRGHSREYDTWRDAGCTGWGFEDVLPFFRKAEGNIRGASHWHGGTGPLKIKRAQANLPICDAFLEAAGQAGFPIFEDMNTDVMEGFGTSDVNVDRGQRISSAVAYLKPARHRANLTVLTQAQALRVIVENGTATGVDVLHAGTRKTIRAEREVIVCGGGIKSPHLLLLSGIGPAEELQAAGVPVVVDSPNVGKNFQNHACYRPQYSVSSPITGYQHLRPGKALKAAADYALFRRGALAESFVAAGGLFKSDSSLDMPDVQVSMIVAVTNVPSSATPSVWQLLPRQEGFSLTVHVTPHSRGTIGLRSADPLELPRVDANYFSDRRDIDSLIAALERVRTITQAPALAKHIKAELKPGDALRDRAALEAEIRSGAANAYHPCGTCAMGSDADSVVDPELRVRGVARLRVADNSILPTVPNAGLHAPAIMIGEKAAAMIAAAG